jgi:hypothetical protein
MKINRINRISGFAACALAGILGSQNASALVLVDGNATATVDPFSQAGMSSWTVDGVEHLNKQWFWYRTGATAESSIDTISAPIISTPTADNVLLTYASAAFRLDVEYDLNGSPPGSGVSSIGETISIVNLTGSPLDFHFFQYSDFNLLNSAGGDSVALGVNFFGKYNSAYQTEGLLAINENGVVPGADRGEVGIVPGILASLNDAAPTTLVYGGPAGPGDVAWAFQWDLVIGAGDQAVISKVKYLEIVPEPGTGALLGIAFAVGLAAFRRRQG